MNTSFIKDSAGTYRTQKPVSKKQIINFAYKLIVPDFIDNTFTNSPAATTDFLKIALADEAKENFGVIFLTSQLQVISFEILARGSLRQTQIPPRTIVQRVIELNASSVILAHNHPSTKLRPSQADEAITATLIDVLSAIDVSVIDHIIVGGNNYFSFAENGLMT